jgi:hypothetical protein
MALLLFAVLLGQAAVYPAQPGSKAHAVVLGEIGVARGESDPGFNMKLASELKKHCPDIKVVADPDKADYFVIFRKVPDSREITVITKDDSEVIHASSSGWSVKKVVKNACAAVLNDFKKKEGKKKSE